MKKSFLISIFSLIVLSFVLMQCTKENSNEIIADNNEITERSDFSNTSIQITSLDESSCFDPPTNCIRKEIDTFIYIPFYYNDTLLCDSFRVRIRASTYYCGGNTIYFDNFIADPAGNCIAFNILYNDLFAANNFDELSRLFDLLEYQASLIFEEIYIKPIVMGLGYNCPNSFLEVNFYKNTCYQWCGEVVSRPGEPLVVNVYKIPCGEKCCKRTRTYCAQNGIVYPSAPIFEEVGNGTCDLIPIETCRGTTWGSCERECGEPK